jgi:hypothetical protein
MPFRFRPGKEGLNRYSVAKIFVSSLIFASLSGCFDLNEVTQLAKTADGAKANLITIAADFKGSCDRQNLYVPVPPPAPPPPEPCVNSDDLDKLGKNLVVEQNVLLSYFNALGKLASIDPTGFEKSANDLDTSFKTAGLSTAQQKAASATAKLASAISKLVLGEYREHTIVSIVKDYNDDVVALANSLAEQVAPCDPSAEHCSPDGTAASYTSLLENERVVMDSYYTIPLGQYLATNKDLDSLVAILVQRQYQLDKTQLQSREDAAKAYRKLMLSLAKAHGKLADAAKNNKFDVKQLSKDLLPDLAQAGEAAVDLQKNSR